MFAPEDGERRLRQEIAQVAAALEVQQEIIQQRSLLEMPLVAELHIREELERMLASLKKRLDELVSRKPAADDPRVFG